MKNKTIKVQKKDYFSPSQINSFIERRSQYVANYVMGESWIGNSSFGRGNAIEFGINSIIDGMEVSQASEAAWSYYKTYCRTEKLSKNEAAKITEDEIKLSTIEVGQFYKNELGATSAVKKQEKIVLELPELSRPIIGYTDYIFPDSPPFKKGEIRDLKTAAKTPSKLSDGYKLAGTVYNLATGRQVIFDYVVNLKAGSKVISIPLTQEDIAEYKPLVIAASRAMEDLWSIIPEEISEDHMDAFKSLAFPNLYSIWNNDERREAYNKILRDYL
jgi:hypothetical protein